MTIVYGEKSWGGWIERHQDNKLFYYRYDSAMGGLLCRYEIGERDLEFALKEEPTGPELELEIYKNWGQAIKGEKYYDDIKKWVVLT